MMKNLDRHCLHYFFNSTKKRKKLTFPPENTTKNHINSKHLSTAMIQALYIILHVNEMSVKSFCKLYPILRFCHVLYT